MHSKRTSDLDRRVLDRLNRGTGTRNPNKPVSVIEHQLMLAEEDPGGYDPYDSLGPCRTDTEIEAKFGRSKARLRQVPESGNRVL